MGAPLAMFAVNRYLIGGDAGVEVRLLAGLARVVAAKAKADRKNEVSMLKLRWNR